MSAPPTPPPPPAGKDRRRYPRYYDLLASVRIEDADHTLVVGVRNISLGGAALAATESELEAFAVGAMHSLLIFDATDDTIPAVQVRGRVVRVDPEGPAFMWAAGGSAQKELTALLAALGRREPT